MAYKFSYVDIVSADVAFKVEADTLSELFEGSARALFQIMADFDDVETKEKEVFDLENEDVGMLLIDFLSELVFLKDTKGVIFSTFDVRIQTDDLGVHKLEAVVQGEKIDYSKRKYKTDVKAITYHQFSISQDDKTKKWTAQVVVDI